jgi:hypothetical protein
VTAGPDRERFKAAAIRKLRVALADGQGVEDALRGCWYRDPAFAFPLLVAALRMRFAAAGDVRLITAFVARIRASRGGPPGAFPGREAEALIRGCLGEQAMLEALDAGRVNLPELGIAIAAGLFEEWRPGAADVEALFGQVETVRQEMAGLMPLAEFEKDWYRAGMADSPFAWLRTDAAREE